MDQMDALQNRCYTCVYNGHMFYPVVITHQSNQSISQFDSPCNEFTSVWSMFVHNRHSI